MRELEDFGEELTSIVEVLKDPSTTLTISLLPILYS